MNQGEIRVLRAHCLGARRLRIGGAAAIIIALLILAVKTFALEWLANTVVWLLGAEHTISSHRRVLIESALRDLGLMLACSGLVLSGLSLTHGGEWARRALRQHALRLREFFSPSPRRQSATSSATKTRSAHLSPKRLIKLAVAIIVLGVLLSRFNWSEAARDVRHMPPAALLQVFVLLTLGLLISAWKWSFALRLHQLEYPLGFLFRVLCIAYFFNSFLPTAVGGDVYRVYRTLPRDGYRSRAFSAVVIDRVTGLIALLMLAAVAAAVLAPRSPVLRIYWLALTAGALAGAVGVLSLERGWLERLAGHWLHVPAWDAALHNIGLLKNRSGEWTALVAGSLAFQTVSISIVFVLFASITQHVTFAQCALITAAVGISSALPISLNGIGVMEGALVATAVALGLSYNDALVVALLRRGMAVLLSCACGVLYLLESRAGAGQPSVSATDETAGH